MRRNVKNLKVINCRVSVYCSVLRISMSTYFALTSSIAYSIAYPAADGSLASCLVDGQCITMTCLQVQLKQRVDRHAAEHTEF